jgi:hypothetical protein
MQLGNHIHIPKSVGECEGMNPQTPKWTLTLGVGILMDFLKSDLKNQNSLIWGLPYTIENLLRHRCLKRGCIIHLSIYSTSYGRKKGQDSKCQFDSWPLKVGIALICVRASRMPHIVEKFSTRITTLLQTSSQSKVCIRNYGRQKWLESQFWEFWDSQLGSSRKNAIWV